MIAVDTNVLVRLLPALSLSRSLPRNPYSLLRRSGSRETVLLETDWVLRRLYGFDASPIRDAFTRFRSWKCIRGRRIVCRIRTKPHLAWDRVRRCDSLE